MELFYKRLFGTAALLAAWIMSVRLVQGPRPDLFSLSFWALYVPFWIAIVIFLERTRLPESKK